MLGDCTLFEVPLIVIDPTEACGGFGRFKGTAACKVQIFKGVLSLPKTLLIFV